MFERVTAIRERQVLAARASKENLLKLRETAKLRLQHYKDLLGGDSDKTADAEIIDSTLTAGSRLPTDTNIPLIDSGVDMSLVDSAESGITIIPKEANAMFMQQQSINNSNKAALAQLIASEVSYYSNITTNAQPLGNGLSATFGSSNVVSAINGIAQSFQHQSSINSIQGSISSTISSWVRRTDDWTLQANLVAREIISLDKQLTSTDIQIQIAEKELKNHQQQIGNSQQTEEFLKTKFSNQELYQWMKEQLYSVYKQSYNLAYEMAKKAEKAYQRELGIETSNFIQYGYWDNANQGLVSGEKLQLALRQLENSFLNNNRREFELLNNISLLQLDSSALLQLKATGKCYISIPESLFDAGTPGHYFRRIKTVALSIPCVVGSYTNVNCTLRLLSSSIRKSKLLPNGNYIRDPEADNRFIDQFSNSESIVTSSSQNDSGLFETNLRDERYLPFENSGVISEWELELPTNPANNEPQQFDYNTISDVILHMRYTAREGGKALRSGANESINTLIKEARSTRFFSMRHDFPTEWGKFKGQITEAGKQIELAINLREEHYPFWLQGLIKIEQIEVFALSKENTLIIYENPDPTNAKQATLRLDKPNYGKLLTGKFMDGENNLPVPEKAIGMMKLYFSTNKLEDLWFVVTWSHT